jgi:hypothetical protein
MELNLSNNVLLEEIACDGCNITVLDLSKCVNIKNISAYMDSLVTLILPRSFEDTGSNLRVRSTVNIIYV